MGFVGTNGAEPEAAEQLHRRIAQYRRVIDDGIDPEENGTLLELIYRAEAQLRQLEHPHDDERSPHHQRPGD